MNRAAFIAGDWGTSNLRLSLCDADGNALSARNGPGVAQISAELSSSPRQDWPARFAALTEDWRAEHGRLPAFLCGMVGSNLGWINVPYAACPVMLDQFAQQLQSTGEQVCIAPGLSCTNRHGAPDVLRGEETQIIGALRLRPALNSGRHLLCLPGTHTKWALIEGGEVCEFITCITGELFALVKQHSVLVRAEHAEATPHLDSFDRAVQQLKREGNAALLQLIFECRSRQIAGDLAPAHAASYLSGLLIAADMMCALQLYAAPPLPITLIGAPQLTSLYARTGMACGVSAPQLDGAQASLAGLTTFYLHRHGHAL